MKRLAWIVWALFFSVLTLSATDLAITYKVEGKGLLAGKPSTETHYYTPKYQLVRNEVTRIDTLVDFEKATSYTIDHGKKTIGMMRMEDALAAMDAMDEQAPGMVGNLMGAMFGDASKCQVEKTGAEEIAGRKCTTYKITVGKLLMIMSADPSLVAPAPAASYTRMLRAKAALMAKAGPSAAAFKRLYEEMSKIKGLPLKTQMSGFMGMNSTSEATAIKEGPLPGTLFTLPAYPVQDVGKQMREDMAKAKKGE